MLSNSTMLRVTSSQTARGVGQYRVALLRYRLEVSQYALNAQAHVASGCSQIDRLARRRRHYGSLRT